MSAAILIDSNIYLKLFGILGGQKLLASLEERRAHIFVSKQIVHEVMRNKLNVANDFFKKQFAKLGEDNKQKVPDQFFGATEEALKSTRKIFDDARKELENQKKLAEVTLSKIARSEDDVSARLAIIFENPVEEVDDDLLKARERKERGNPPGFARDPLGDQITWQQFLRFCSANKVKSVWIISEDTDYSEKIEGKRLLNPFLDAELAAIGVETRRCFEDLLKAIDDMRTSGIKFAELTPAEKKDLRKQFDTLPAVRSLPGFISANTTSAFITGNTSSIVLPSSGVVFRSDSPSFFSIEKPETEE